MRYTILTLLFPLFTAITPAVAAIKGEITATVADGGSCVPSAGKGVVFAEYGVHN